MTPYEIEIALKYYYSPESEIRDAPIRDETLRAFEAHGLLERAGSDAATYYVGTEKLRAYCEALQFVPLPVQKWVIP